MLLKINSLFRRRQPSVWRLLIFLFFLSDFREDKTSRLNNPGFPLGRNHENWISALMFGLFGSQKVQDICSISTTAWPFLMMRTVARSPRLVADDFFLKVLKAIKSDN